MGNLNEILFETAEGDRATAAGTQAPAVPVVAVPVVGRLTGFDDGGRPQVRLPVDILDEIAGARTTVELKREQIGCEVLLLCERGDPRRPVIVGVLRAGSEPSAPERPPRKDLPMQIEADGDRCLISAEREVVLKCGDASITLTRAGKVVIKGNYILSRSTGYNKLKGAAIDIN